MLRTYQTMALLLIVLFAGCELSAQAQSAIWNSYLQKGDELLSNHDYAAAEKVWELAIKELKTANQDTNPALMRAEANLALTKQKENKFEEAESEYKIATELAKKMNCEKVYALLFDDFGTVEVALKKYDAAEVLYRQALGLVEDDSSLTGRQLRILTNLQSVFMLQNKDLEASALQTQIDTLKARKSDMEDSPLLLYRRGIADLQNKKFDSAIYFFDRAAKRDPERSAYTLNLGIAHQNYAVALVGHDDAEAESQYKTAVSIFEKSNATGQMADAYEGLLILYVSQKRYKEADALSTQLLHLREAASDRPGYLKAYGLYKTVMIAENKSVVLPAEPRPFTSKEPGRTQEKNLNEYDRAFRSEIQRKWIALSNKYPGTDATNGKQRGTIIEVYIGADGSLKGCYVQPISHEKDVDDRAKEAVQSVFPFKKPPVLKDDLHKIRVYFSVNGVNQS